MEYLKSCGCKSCSYEETDYWFLKKGEFVVDRNNKVIFTAPEGGATVAIDESYVNVNGWLFTAATFVRDSEPGRCEIGSKPATQGFREMLRKRGAALKNVPGQVWPIVPKGMVLVSDYNMSGTNYFMIPERIYPALV